MHFLGLKVIKNMKLISSTAKTELGFSRGEFKLNCYPELFARLKLFHAL